MSTNISSKCVTIEGFSELSYGDRRLTLRGDFCEKRRSRMCFSPSPSSTKSRDFSMPCGFSRQFNIDSSSSYGAIMKSLNPELLTKSKLMVNEAIMKKKIFAIYGPYDKIRKTLKSRGWVEKITDEKALLLLCNKLYKRDTKTLSPKQDNSSSNDKGVSAKTEENEELNSIASLLVLNCVPDFIWSLRLTQVDERCLKPNQIINHFKNAGSFTTKTGLIKSFNFMGWYEKNNDEVFPRSYILTDENEKKAFLDDYYLTACMSLLKLTSEINSTFVQQSKDKTEHDVPSIYVNSSKYEDNKVKPLINYDVKEIGDSKYKIDRRYTDMAMNYCELYLKYFTNKDLDQKQIVFCSLKRWEEFFNNYYRVINEGYGIDCTDGMRERSKYLCKELQKIYPQYYLDGTQNIWIVKPGAKSRGRGIFCASKFSDINDVVRTTSDILIVQKYIENPLLVYKTKFDIRQWFLVTDWCPLTIWWYNDSYIRFCSQQFTLNDFNESVHLSNNSIQYKYQNGMRSKLLPIDNMWEWRTLEKYLNDNGYKDGWKKKILPAMKNIIIDILLCSQEEIEDRKNSFELYGADFMVTADDLKTWLLEINSSPCMAPSTDITAKLTKSVLEDVIKVLLDYSKDLFCDTGQFELLYKQSPFSNPVLSASDKLTVYGVSIKKPNSGVFLSKREMSSRKCNVRDDPSVLRNKIKQIAENFKAIREASRLQESLVNVNDHRLTEPKLNQTKSKLADDIKQPDAERQQRRSRSHNPEYLRKTSFLLHRKPSNKSHVSPILTHSGDDPEVSRYYKPFIRPLDHLKKMAGDESIRLSDQQQNQIKCNNMSTRLKLLNCENTLSLKLQSWKQMNVNQRTLPANLQRYNS